MKTRTVFAALTALVVFAFGAGIEPLRSAPIDNVAYETLLRSDPVVLRSQATLLPTVVVVGHAPAAPRRGERASVMLDDAVVRAERAITDGVDAGMRRLRVDVPFHTFNRSARSAQ